MKEDSIQKYWKYYNHALIPNLSPSESKDISEISGKDIRKINKKALFARWTTDFDCENQTEWWWIVKDAPYCIEELSKSSQKHIRQAINKCEVKKVKVGDYKKELWRVYDAAYTRYKNADNRLTEDKFFEMIDSWEQVDCWIAIDFESKKTIGWMTCKNFAECTIIETAKYDPEYLNKRASDAIHNRVCEYYLNEKGKKFITAGERSINHVSNSQEYKVKNFNFRRAYCKLNVRYTKTVMWVVRLIYPFRKIICKINKLPFVHSVDAVLKMEEINRSFN